MQQVVVTIKPDGSTSIEVNGVKGNSCLTKSLAYVKALGVQATQINKPEMFEVPATTSAVVQTKI